MFANLRQGSQLYILHKTATPYIEVGSVESVTNIPMYGIYPTMPTMPVDVTVRVGEKLTTYKQIPANVDVANVTSPNTGEELCIATTKDCINNEVQTMIQKSIDTISSVPFHEQRVKSLKALYQQFNPEEAEKAQRDKEYQDMKTEMQEMRKQMAEQAEINKQLLAQLKGEGASSNSKKGEKS